MFKVGMGETPDAPPTLSQEGHDFLDHCLQVGILVNLKKKIKLQTVFITA